MSQDYISIYRPNADQLYQVVTAVGVQAVLRFFRLEIIHTF